MDCDTAGNVVPVNLSIRVGNLLYEDHLEWDMDCPENSPELFARTTVAELGKEMSVISNCF